MFKLNRIFETAPAQSEIPYLNKDKIAKLLKTNPETISAFEKAYNKHALNNTPNTNNFFDINAKQASAMHKTDIDTNLDEKIKTIIDRIVCELMSVTSTYIYNGKTGYTTTPETLPIIAKAVTNEEINNLPEELKPQLTGSLMKIDIDEPSYPSLLYMYDKYLNHPNPEMRKTCYNHFKQGLDILDLDEITYKIISTNRNSIGHWFPELVNACANQTFFKLPKTTITKVPMSILQLTRQPYTELTKTTMQIVNQWAKETFDLKTDHSYFIKTGTYSSKYDFRNAKVTGEKEVLELGEYLLFIHHQALQMASPLSTPCITGVSTTTEWVVREFIEDTEHNPCIYKGMPLHTEYRLFIDCDQNRVIGCSPYWEPKTMKKRFKNGSNKGNLHDTHDYIIYKAHEKTLMERYNKNKKRIMNEMKNLLPNLELQGQWSIDVMQNGNEFYIIDMALAENSALYECVPKHLRKPSEENWLPVLK